MRKESLYIKVAVDGEERSFPLSGNGVRIGTYTYSATRMGSAPTITAEFMYGRCLDDEWTYKEYVEFNGERYYVSSVPSSSKSNDDERYKHEITFTAQRIVLENEFFYDVVTAQTEEQYADRYRSNGTEFSFMGDIAEFAARLNDCLIYVGLYDPDTDEGYKVVIDEGIESDTIEVSFTDKYIAEALQEISNTYELAYYFVGTVIHIGYTENFIEKPFAYGRSTGLLEVQRTNANYKLIDRITGVGGSVNIEYYYPNDDAEGLAQFTVENMEKEQVAGISIATIRGYNDNPYAYPFVLCRYADMPTVDILSGLTLYVDDAATSGLEVRFYEDFNVSSSTVDESGGTYVRTVTHYLDFKVNGVKGGRLDIAALTVQGSGSFNNTAATMGMTIDVTKQYGLWDASEYSNVPVNGIIKFDADGVYRVGLQVDITMRLTPISYLGAIEGTANIVLTVSGLINYDMGAAEQYFFEYGTESVGYSLSGIELIDKSTLPCKIYDYSYSGGTWVRTLTSDSSDNPATIWVTGRLYIAPCGNIMPSIYRETWGAERYYNAVNNVYELPEGGGYYTFKNLYEKGNPHAGRQSDDTIIPTIKDMVNANGELLGEIADIAYDDNDNDLLDDDNNYIHSYFYIKLHIYNGDYGFNIFEHALSSDTAKINMTSGNCAACEFEIGVSWNADNTIAYNPVQVDGNGNIVSGDYADKVNVENIQDEQQDTSSREVWIAVKKDNTTYGIVMPNATNNYKPSVGDTFVLTGISLPKVYILAAEKRLDEVLIKYMKENNEEKFTYSITFSRIYLARHEDIAAMINENARLNVEYNGNIYTLFVTDYTCKADENILCEVTVELAEELTVGASALSQTLSAMKEDIYNSVRSGASLTGPYIRKDRSDGTPYNLDIGGSLTVEGQLRAKLLAILQNGAQFGSTFITGLLGVGGKIDGSGAGELDSLFIRKWLEVPEIRYNRVSVYTGVAWQTFGAGIIESVEIDTDGNGNELQSGVITLKLEDGEYGCIAIDDLCMGIFHNFEGGNDEENYDQRNGNFNFAGFQTSYFRIDEILDTSNNGKFHYVLRGISDNWKQQVHPQQAMHFACYANANRDVENYPELADRHACKYSTTEYEIRLQDMYTWEYGEANIYYIAGKLEGFQMSGRVFEGSGVVIGNGYYFGTLTQFDKISYEMRLDTQGDYFLSYGETVVVSACVLKFDYGYEDVTTEATDWKVVRESGMNEEDAVWNADHLNALSYNSETGYVEMELTYEDLGVNYATVRTLFTISATVGDDTVENELIIKA